MTKHTAGRRNARWGMVFSALLAELWRRVMCKCPESFTRSESKRCSGAEVLTVWFGDLNHKDDAVSRAKRILLVQWQSMLYHVLYCFSAFIPLNIPFVQLHCVNDKGQADNIISLDLFHNKSFSHTRQLFLFIPDRNSSVPV